MHGQRGRPGAADARSSRRQSLLVTAPRSRGAESSRTRQQVGRDERGPSRGRPRARPRAGRRTPGCRASSRARSRPGRRRAPARHRVAGAARGRRTAIIQGGDEHPAARSSSAGRRARRAAPAPGTARSSGRRRPSAGRGTGPRLARASPPTVATPAVAVAAAEPAAEEQAGVGEHRPGQRDDERDAEQLRAEGAGVGVLAERDAGARRRRASASSPRPEAVTRSVAAARGPQASAAWVTAAAHSRTTEVTVAPCRVPPSSSGYAIWARIPVAARPSRDGGEAGLPGDGRGRGSDDRQPAHVAVLAHQRSVWPVSGADPGPDAAPVTRPGPPR